MPRGVRKKKIEETYQQLTDYEQIVLRPGMFLGDTEPRTEKMWVWNDTTMQRLAVVFEPALYKVVDEIILNAYDQSVRFSDGLNIVKHIHMCVSPTDISIENDGSGLDVAMHQECGVYVPEMVFGHLRTSSNYDDTEKRIVGGTYGLGAKLTNIFARWMIIETVDATRQLKYVQRFDQNMTIIHPPKITSAKSKKPYTKVTWQPDLTMLKSPSPTTGISADMQRVLYRRCCDLVAVTGKKVKVSFNGSVITSHNDLESYARLFLPVGTPIISKCIHPRWEIAVALSPQGSFQHVSFVNAIYTSLGGTHVKHVVDTLIKNAFMDKTKKGKGITKTQIQNHMMVFIRCSIENPTFSSQSKEQHTTPMAKFGSKCDFPDTFLRNVRTKTGIFEQAHQLAQFRIEQQATSSTSASTITSRKKRVCLSKLDDADWAGTSRAMECTLILTEGDSAKALAISGISSIKEGHQKFGVFPLRGKFLNVQDATPKQLLENEELIALKHILGIQSATTPVSMMRYGHILLMTDADVDGSHIKGLLMNLFQTFWPHVIKTPGFLRAFFTPIIRVTKGSVHVQDFYSLREFQQWERQKRQSGLTIRYLKGLGTSTSQDGRRYFQALATSHKGETSYSADEDTVDNFVLAFGKGQADARKEWIHCTLSRMAEEPNMFLSPPMDPDVSLSRFIHEELVQFSIYDNQRSIPSVVDGWKPSQRKVFFGSRHLTSSIKVEQLAGKISEKSAYHHGETSLKNTIVNLAQNYVGSNHIAILVPDGQYGSRIGGGKDHASPRYIYTSMHPITQTIFPSADDPILQWQTEEGQSIEPMYYLPIIPMVLINGAEGIGTGWSTSVPSYNVLDIIDRLERWMSTQSLQTSSPLVPYIQGFQGTIEPINSETYKMKGTWQRISSTELDVTEIPVGTSFDKYKEWLETHLVTCKKPILQDYRILSMNENHIHLRLVFTDASIIDEWIKKRTVETNLHLVQTISTHNMHLFNTDGILEKYDTPEAIIIAFAKVRWQGYVDRRAYHLPRLAHQMKIAAAQIRFIEDIRTHVLDMYQDEDMLIQTLDKQKYPHDEGTYHYLLDMPFRNCTIARQAKLNEKHAQLQKEYNHLLNQTPNQMWQMDLNALKRVYSDYVEHTEHIEDCIQIVQTVQEHTHPRRRRGKKVNRT